MLIQDYTEFQSKKKMAPISIEAWYEIDIAVFKVVVQTK